MPSCSICRKKDDNPTDYGEFMEKSDIRVHYYCLLLSTHLPQNGKDGSGIMGFLLRDIRNEIEKSKERTCCYCEQPHASLGCFKCKIYFHNICGNANNCVSEFRDDFRSYCHQDVPFRREAFIRKSNPSCWICFEALGNYHPVRILKANCCNTGYVHRHCMRKHALSAGYQLKCIWCPSAEFRNDIRKQGVFVPDREPIWDNNETLRYIDQHRGYSRCDAKDCVCPKGREYFTQTKWKLMICCACGSSGVHKVCGQQDISKDKYTCETCRLALTNAKRHNTRTSKQKANNSMFVSKIYKETADLLQVANNLGSLDEDDSYMDELSSSKKVSSQHSEPPRKNPSTEASTLKAVSKQIDKLSLKDILSLGQGLQCKPRLRQVSLVANNSDIIGTVTVPEDKIRRNPEGFVCREEDIVEYSNTNAIIEAIFDEIESERRDLSTKMVDEVFDRLKLWLETNELEAPVVQETPETC